MKVLENQNQRLDYLIDRLKRESDDCRDITVKNDFETKKVFLRALMNIRLPREIPVATLDVQDDYLQEQNREKGIVAIADIPTINEGLGLKMRMGEILALWQGDITRLKVDAIVNAANAEMLGCFIPNHRCIDNAIHSSAGMALRLECANYMNSQRCIHGNRYIEPTGQAAITNGYNLPARHVIHTVGPIVEGQLTDTHRSDLKNCYYNVLECAKNNGIKTLAFCCISTGEYRFDSKEAANIAIQCVLGYLKNNKSSFDRIIFNVFKDKDLDYYQEVLASIAKTAKADR